MSSRTLKDDKAKVVAAASSRNSGMISHRCLGIVLKRTAIHRRRTSGKSDGGGECYSSASSPHVNGFDSTAVEDWMFESGYLVFQDFQEENRQCFWNRTLVDSVNGIEYMGYVAPGTLLVGGNEFYLEAIRSAWARRVLKSPMNFLITRLGDVTGFEMQVIPQTQFTPLPEALCLVISDLNSDKETASLEIIFSQLQDRFSDMIVPNQDIVYVSLGKLIKDRKVYHTSDGYFIVTPETYHVTTVPTMPERPLLLTNEEAIHRLHGGQLLSPLRSSTEMRTRSIQTSMDEFSLCARDDSPSSERNLNTLSRLERYGSLRLSRKEKHKSKDADRGSVVRSESMRLSPEKSKSLIKDINLKSSLAHQDVEKGEKVSVFSKLFRRSSSKRRKSSKSPAKYATFSSQFPPLEWSDPNVIHYHSRSTQTLDGRRSSSSSSRLLTMGSDSGLVSTRLATDSDLHQRSSIQRPLSSVTISSAAPLSNGNANANATMSSPNHKSNDISANNNNTTGMSINNNNNNSCAASPPSMKSKTDSLSRFRDQHEKHNQQHYQLRVRSSTLDCVNPEHAAARQEQLGLNSSAAATPLERSAVAVTPLSPSKMPSSSGLPVRKLHSHSCIVLQESPSAKRRSSTPSKTRGQSPAASTSGLKASPVHVVATSPRSSPSTTKQTTSTPSKIVNTDRPSSYIGSHHRSAEVNRIMDETKVKNTEHQRIIDEEYKLSSMKVQNRWSAHARNGGETPAIRGTSGSTMTPITTTTMNNVTSPSKKGTGSKNYRQSAFKCVNKLNGGGSQQHQQQPSSSTPKHVSNVTAAVRPTQAIRPLTQSDSVELDPINGDDVDALGGTTSDFKLAAADDDKASLTMTPSLSFNKSFDIESSAFKSITAQKLLKGASINSIDTLVEVNMAAERSNEEDNSAGATTTGLGRRTSYSSSSKGHHQDQCGAESTFRRKVFNHSAQLNPPSFSTQQGTGKQSGAVQPRMIGEAHKMEATPATEGSTKGQDIDALGDLKKPNAANESESIATIMAVI